MSPNGQIRDRKAAANNIYTLLVAIALCIVLSTAFFVAYKCYVQYGTFFKIP